MRFTPIQIIVYETNKIPIVYIPLDMLLKGENEKAKLSHFVLLRKKTILWTHDQHASLVVLLKYVFSKTLKILITHQLTNKHEISIQIILQKNHLQGRAAFEPISEFNNDP